MKQRLQVNFHGQVQGVGFRYTAYHTAQMYGLTGWVRNEYDGSVTAQVQGSQEEIEAWLEHLNNDRYIGIDWMEKKTLDVDEGERSFQVRGC